MNSEDDHPCGWGCPIRRSRDHRSLASPPGFSQRATSFIASQCQGIHQMPFLVLDRRHRPVLGRCRTAAAHRAKTRCPERPRMKTLLRTHPVQARISRPAKLCFAERGRSPPGASASVTTTLSSPCNQHPRPDHPDGVSGGRTRRMVEVNGFEPMTSCLQSRRSPS